jgi:hypothetical protein
MQSSFNAYNKLFAKFDYIGHVFFSTVRPVHVTVASISSEQPKFQNAKVAYKLGAGLPRETHANGIYQVIILTLGCDEAMTSILCFTKTNLLLFSLPFRVVGVEPP